MKKLFNGLSKAGLAAILFAAVVFTTTSAFKSKPVADYVFLLNPAGTEYSRFSTDGSFPTEGSCTPEDLPSCYITYDSDPLVTSFLVGDEPGGGTPSEQPGYWLIEQ